MARSSSLRMPRAIQRRLDDLIDKTKSESLTAAEQKELQGLLEDVDRQSFWMLARKLVLNKGPKPIPQPHLSHQRAAL